MKKKNQRPIVTETALQTPTNNVNPTPDNSPIIPQRSKLKNELHIIERPDFSENQKKFIELALNKNTKLLFVSGPAGTAKSFLSIYCALKLLNQRRVSDLIYVRSAVECADSKMGFLPGLISDKLQPYSKPLMDKLEELLPKNEINILMKEERISSIPINYLRGLNWNAKTILLDESQNCTYKEILTFITRVGEFSKVFVIGDGEQSDINGRSGMLKMINNFEDEESRQNGIFTFKFDVEDIVRSRMVQFIIRRTRL